jgi:hypothetical protein
MGRKIYDWSEVQRYYDAGNNAMPVWPGLDLALPPGTRQFVEASFERFVKDLRSIGAACNNSTTRATRTANAELNFISQPEHGQKPLTAVTSRRGP